MFADTSHLALGEERIPPGEAAQIDELAAILRSIQETKDRRQCPVPRTVHPKQHGCVYAELVIEPDLPGELRHGVFRDARTYPAVVRFSNARQRHDQLPDAHGMAIKLIGVDGERLLPDERDATTQDLVAIDHPVFFARNVAELLPLARDYHRLMTRGVGAKVWTGLKGALSPEQGYRLLRRTAAKRPESPLQTRYWSTTPYKLGDGAMKFSLRPVSAAPPRRATASADKLRLALQAHLQERAARFEFLVQLQTDPVTMPIEDATVPWSETESPFQRVATLVIPRQACDSELSMEWGEGLSFSPWHGVQAHRPLGGINRARRKVYEIMAARRRELGGVPKREPGLEDVRRHWTFA